MLAGERPRRMAGYRQDENDAFLDTDIGYPNRRAQYRGHLAIVFLILVAGVVTLIAGISEGTQEIAGAFPTVASLSEGAAWAKLLTGLGRLTTVGLIVIAVALLWRWRIRRARRR
jgi:hypothetical protein